MKNGFSTSNFHRHHDKGSHLKKDGKENILKSNQVFINLVFCSFWDILESQKV